MLSKTNIAIRNISIINQNIIKIITFYLMIIFERNLCIYEQYLCETLNEFLLDQLNYMKNKTLSKVVHLVLTFE